MGFREAVMTGMARDGGLLLPEEIPDVRNRLERWRGLSYPELAIEIFTLFGDIPSGDIDGLVRRSYATFRHPEVTPVVPVGGVHILELFHGPTLAFKDVALQFLGNLFEYVLRDSMDELNIIGATSGDTGSAAIQGVRGRDRIRIFILHPNNRVSPVQERQMTSVLDPNVFNIAVEGTFDDCQSIVRSLFGDLAFKDRLRLGSINSINWARILAQIVYYFYSAFRVMDATGASRVRFSVPTGNFGDIFAGYMAARMGLPVGKLILGTNDNDILSRFFRTGEYRIGKVCETLSPSMDIQVASNFERYLYYRLGCDPALLSEHMEIFGKTGTLSIAGHATDDLFAAGACDTQGTLDAMREFHGKYGYVLDPHTAVGVSVAQRHMAHGEPMICLATAHPAKFCEAVERATGRSDLARHPVIDALAGLPARRTVLRALTPEIRHFVESHVKAGSVESR